MPPHQKMEALTNVHVSQVVRSWLFSYNGVPDFCVYCSHSGHFVGLKVFPLWKANVSLRRLQVFRRKECRQQYLRLSLVVEVVKMTELIQNWGKYLQYLPKLRNLANIFRQTWKNVPCIVSSQVCQFLLFCLLL